MARPRKVQPSYLLHKPSGQARVRVNGRDIYLGPYNSPESWQKYHELLARFPTPESRLEVIEPSDQTTVAELVAHFVEHANSWYTHNPDEKYRIKAGIEVTVAKGHRDLRRSRKTSSTRSISKVANGRVWPSKSRPVAVRNR